MFCLDSSEQPQTAATTNIPCQIPDNMPNMPFAPVSPRLSNRMMPPPPSMVPTMPSSSFFGQMPPSQNIPSPLIMQRRASIEGFAEPEPQMSKKKSKQEKSRHNRQGRKFKHEIDTNVICLKLKVLKDDAQLAAGDPIFCLGCKAVFNMYSKLGEQKAEEGKLEDIKEEGKLEDIKEEVEEAEEAEINKEEEKVEQAEDDADEQLWI